MNKKGYTNRIVSMGLLALLLSIVLFPGSIPVSAEEIKASDSLNDGITIEIVPNEVIEASLPAYLRDALNDDAVTYGISRPGSNDIYNLSNGEYYFSVDTVLDTTIYSKYVFIGHDGKVNFYINDTSTASGDYTVKVYKKGLIDTTIYTRVCDHDASTSFGISFDDAEAKIYFAIIPDGTTRISSNSYIAKG